MPVYIIDWRPRPKRRWVGKDEPLKPMPALSAGAVGDQFYEDRAAGLAQRVD